MSVREVTDKELVYLKLKLDWENLNVRIALAVSGVALNILVHDRSVVVRHEVAKHGYGLDILDLDPDPTVRAMSKEMRKAVTYAKAKNIVDEMFRQAGCL